MLILLRVWLSNKKSAKALRSPPFKAWPAARQPAGQR
jgi:hypothetical protein